MRRSYQSPTPEAFFDGLIQAAMKRGDESNATFWRELLEGWKRDQAKKGIGRAWMN